MQFECAVMVYHCVASIISALKTNNYIIFLSDIINHFSSSLITALSSNNDIYRHVLKAPFKLF